MNEGPEWFAPKRYGFGSVPITWQGWAVTIAFIVVVTVLAFTLARQPIRLFAALVPLLVGFIVICAKTTRGGWRWRWGRKDD
jgi:amino acid transporter